MDLGRMLEKCVREQWSPADLDWRATPPNLTREKEMAVVQYFTDMAGIERLAGALFRVEGQKTREPTLKKILASFEHDEVRHSHVAQMLADYYDVHKYKLYQPNPHLLRFAPHFVKAVEHLAPHIANLYITTGELLLDIALLRSLDDYVADQMSHRAMELINRDESRHLAIDFHMIGYYTSEEYLNELASTPKKPLGERVRAWRALATMMYHARPFFKDVFFGPIDMCDPSGKRLREAFKRIQLLATKDGVRKLSFNRFLLTMQALYNTPVVGFIFGRALLRIMGIDPRVAPILYTDAEASRARAMSYDELAEDAVNAKYTFA
jgi:hypothetical protein